jgi:aminopeptidase N
MPGKFSNSFFLKLFLSTFFFVFVIDLSAQMPGNGLDAKNYRYNLLLNDSNNIIKGNAVITTGFTKNERLVVFDLVNRNEDGKGMTVTSVTKNGNAINFSQDSQHLIINDEGLKGKENVYNITYEGIPEDGLIISNTEFGDRSFFADNWPNRAHNWIPCNDHLSDKATVEFIVTAPDHYEVVSNGEKMEEINLPGHLKRTYWKENVPLPTKVMVIGVTNFAVSHFADVNRIPVSSWVYPENKDSGFKHYAIAKNILEWYIKKIGAYPYEKLANVQSKTIFGGMENASCIFYFENSVNDPGIESLFAHEIAHQWFGDNVTEKDWPHLWLSEGFATYMTDLYLENKYGKDSLKNLLKQQRQKVLRFYKDHKTPVVDTSGTNDLMHLLNANSYQKGAWILHLLRRKVGDSLFWKAIRDYYKTFAGKNASTQDFEKIFEKVTHQNLATFFSQWLFNPGQPMLNIQWNYNKTKKSVSIKIEQTQPNFFEFPLQIAFVNGNEKVIKTIEVRNKITEKEIPMPMVPTELITDPDVNLLFEAKCSMDLISIKQ